MTHLNDFEGKRIWIIGASTGIGKALAYELDRRGAELTLSARREELLKQISTSLSKPAVTEPLDVRDRAALSRVASSSALFDSVIFLSAVYTPGLIESINPVNSDEMIDINIKGALNTVDAVYPLMRTARKGQIILCGSTAGYCGLPYSQPYSLTKAAIMSLAQSLRVEAERHNIDVKLISPGFVRTPLTDRNDFKMPMIIEPSQAAKEIADGMLGHRFEICFPKKFTGIIKFLKFIPYTAYFKISREILDKKIKSERENSL